MALRSYDVVPASDGIDDDDYYEPGNTQDSQQFAAQPHSLSGEEAPVKSQDGQLDQWRAERPGHVGHDDGLFDVSIDEHFMLES